MEEKILIGPIKIEGSKDNKASDILQKAFYDTISKIKLNMPFKADGFKPEKVPNQPDGTPIVVEPANIKQGGLEKGKTEVKPIGQIKKVEPKVEPKIVKKTKKGGK